MGKLAASLLMLIATMSSAFAEGDKPTFEADPNPPERATGMVRDPKVQSFEQFKSDRDFQAIAEQENWTFDYDVSQIGQHAMGLDPIHTVERPPVAMAPTAERMKPLTLQDFGKDLGPVLNQGSCGSCVVFSIMQNWTANMRLRGLEYPDLSPSHLMNCGGQGGQCGGDYAERVAQRLVNLKTLFSVADYPYVPRSSGCSESRISGERYGKISGFKTIEGNPESILAALHQGIPVSATVAADRVFSSYRGGTYNGCSSMGTNHEVTIFGVGCGTSVDSEGYCKFQNGKFPAGIGTYYVRNSWGEQWGDKGHITMQVTGRSGQKCNNIADEAVILDVGMPMPIGPVEFVVENDDVYITVTIAAGASFTQADAKSALESALSALGE